MPERPECERRQSNHPDDGDRARQRARQRVPVKLERHQSLSYDESRRDPRLRSKRLAIPVAETEKGNFEW